MSNSITTSFQFGGKNRQKIAALNGGIAATEVNPDSGNEEPTLSQELQAHITSIVTSRMSPGAAKNMPEAKLIQELEGLIAKIIDEEKIQANQNEQRQLARNIVNDLIGLGPLEELKNEENITDIMVNGPSNVFVEKNGRTILLPMKFRSEQHLRDIANRIARSMNRPLDEAHPLLDARLADGSRVNIVIPPVAIDGTTISIRKFSKDNMTLDILANPPPGRQPALSHKMRDWLAMAARCRYNILISGGTSTGKTTMLNAVSRYIDNNERIVTIEDAAELRLQQPHVVRLETRRNTGGDSNGEDIDQGRLVHNALRMRPDRIILGEVRGGEAFDLLSAMNTGHDGSLGTLHANTPRDALSRLENMVLMSGYELPSRVIRNQIQSAVDMIIQIERLPDGSRRIMSISEVTGIEGDVITLQELFRFSVLNQINGKIVGEFVSSGNQPYNKGKLRNYGLEDDARRLFTE